MTKKTLHCGFKFLFILLISCSVFRTGSYESYYRNGQVKFTGFYESGRKNGLFRSFSKDGEPIYEKQFKNGKLHGKSIWFTELGTPQATGHFQNGVKWCKIVQNDVQLCTME